MRRNLTRKENQYCFTLMITKIVALSKTKGDTISGYINSLIEKEISNLDSIDTERYKKFLNNNNYTKYTTYILYTTYSL